MKFLRVYSMCVSLKHIVAICHFERKTVYKEIDLGTNYKKKETKKQEIKADVFWKKPRGRNAFQISWHSTMLLVL